MKVFFLLPKLLLVVKAIAFVRAVSRYECAGDKAVTTILAGFFDVQVRAHISVVSIGDYMCLRVPGSANWCH